MAKKKSIITIMCERTPKAFKWKGKTPLGWRGYNCYIVERGRKRACIHPVTGRKNKCVDIAHLAKAPYGPAE